MSYVSREEVAIDSCQFASMSFVAAVLIVLLHLGSHDIDKIVAIALPWFFLASGFFLAKHIGEANWYKIAIIKRLRSLVVPFYIWMLIYKALYIMMHYMSGSMDQHPFDWNLCLYFTGFHPFIPVQIVWYLRTLFCWC